MYYTVCPHCGANLDPGERCDCEKEKLNTPENVATVQDKEGQLTWVLEQELQAS